MIDVSKVRYDLVVFPPAGGELHLAPLASKLQWEEQPQELAVRLTAAFANQQLTSGSLHELLPNGARLQLISDWGLGWMEVLRGSVFRWNNSDTGPLTLTITAYDQLIYLMKSKDDRYYPAGTTGRTIITDIAQDWGIPLGTVEGPDVALPKNLFRSQNLAQMILTALDQTKKRGGGKWIVRSREGVIDIVRAGQNIPVYWLRSDETVETVEEERSIEDLVTRVQIVGSGTDEARAPVLATLDGKTEFGVLQDLVTQSSSDSPDSARQEAEDLLAERGDEAKTRKLTGPDLPFLRRGDKVRATAGTLDGYFLVTGVQHDGQTGRMSLEVEDL